MRIIAIRTLKSFWTVHANAEGALRAWYHEVDQAEWQNPARLKDQFKMASILSSKRVVFNIKGNAYRLIVDIEYRLQLVFIVWIGTHKEYEKINARTVGYDKANKK